MNVFVLDCNPKIAARYMCDKHVHKMVVESSQLLANCYQLTTLTQAPLTQKQTARKHSYIHHGCSKWAQAHVNNYWWLLNHAESLILERYYRWPERAPHFCYDFIAWCFENKPDNIADMGFVQDNWGTEPYLAMPDEFKSPNPVQAYRRYYNEHKRNTIDMQWTTREPPEWYRA